jgi:hypothetical protein
MTAFPMRTTFPIQREKLIGPGKARIVQSISAASMYMDK